MLPFISSRYINVIFFFHIPFSWDLLLLGEVLWTTDKTRLHDGWNIYSPATVQDLDYDGVGEIVIAHGGDPVIPAEVCMLACFTDGVS